ncbi:MAG: SDR family oxidoreductase [Ignavibacteriae bacterium]|nr:SDR family oxidoreductase [Ignavibacteriota bacterium]
MSVSKNRVALITGSARRLGKEIAKALAGNGFDLVLHYNSSPRSSVIKLVNEFKKQGIVVHPVKADLRKVSEIKKLFAEINSRFGRLDLLVNNAAVFRKVDFFDIDEKIFDEFINTNLKNALLCSVEAAKIMNKSKEKNLQIINIASLGGILNWTDHIPYSVAKAGVIKLTQLMAKRLAPKILVNAIAPGTIMIENDANNTVVMKEKEKYPVKHFGKSSDITSVIIFLVKENSFITGHTFIVDGGRSL